METTDIEKINKEIESLLKNNKNFQINYLQLQMS